MTFKELSEKLKQSMESKPKNTTKQDFELNLALTISDFDKRLLELEGLNNVNNN